MSFFRKLKNVNSVNIIGHSLGEVDILYFKTVMNSVSSDTERNIYYYWDEERDTLKNALLSLGIENILLLSSNDFWNI